MATPKAARILPNASSNAMGSSSPKINAFPGSSKLSIRTVNEKKTYAQPWAWRHVGNRVNGASSHVFFDNPTPDVIANFVKRPTLISEVGLDNLDLVSMRHMPFPKGFFASYDSVEVLRTIFLKSLNGKDKSVWEKLNLTLPSFEGRGAADLSFNIVTLGIPWLFTYGSTYLEYGFKWCAARIGDSAEEARKAAEKTKNNAAKFFLYAGFGLTRLLHLTLGSMLSLCGDVLSYTRHFVNAASNFFVIRPLAYIAFLFGAKDPVKNYGSFSSAAKAMLLNAAELIPTALVLTASFLSGGVLAPIAAPIKSALMITGKWLATQSLALAASAGVAIASGYAIASKFFSGLVQRVSTAITYHWRKWWGTLPKSGQAPSPPIAPKNPQVTKTPPVVKNQVSSSNEKRKKERRVIRPEDLQPRSDVIRSEGSGSLLSAPQPVVVTTPPPSPIIIAGATVTTLTDTPSPEKTSPARSRTPSLSKEEKKTMTSGGGSNLIVVGGETRPPLPDDMTGASLEQKTSGPLLSPPSSPPPSPSSAPPPGTTSSSSGGESENDGDNNVSPLRRHSIHQENRTPPTSPRQNFAASMRFTTAD